MLRLNLVIVTVSMIFVLAINQSKEHNYCCTPQKWECSVWGVGGTELPGNRSARLWITARAGFDGENWKRYYIENQTVGAEFTSRKYIEDFRSGNMYVINLLKNSCVKSRIEEPFNEGCIPDDAVHLYRMYYGLHNDSFYVNVYKLRLNSSVKALDDYLVVTENGCVPISESLGGSYNGAVRFLTQNYFDMTPGITDESIFTVPDNCRQTTIRYQHSLRRLKLGLI